MIFKSFFAEITSFIEIKIKIIKNYSTKKINQDLKKKKKLNKNITVILRAEPNGAQVE